MNDPHPKDGKPFDMAGNNLARVCGVRPEFIQSTPALPMPEHIGGSEGGEVAPGISREDVIRMAREAGFYLLPDSNCMMDIICIERTLEFAAKVAATERESCATLVASWNTAMTDKLAATIRARGSK